MASDLTFLGPNFLIGTMRAEMVLALQGRSENEGASGRPAPCLGVCCRVYSADDAIVWTASQAPCFAPGPEQETEYSSFPS